MGAAKASNLIDGFSSVQAVRRAGKQPQAPHFAPSRTRLQGPAKDKDGKKHPESGARIGHTAIPPTHEIICYECGYTFTLRGRVQDTYCPKCRKILKVEDHVLDKEFKGVIKTIGRVDVQPGARLHDAKLVVMDLALGGRVENCHIQVFRQLTLCAGAAGDLTDIAARDLTVASGSRFSFRKKLNCTNLLIKGELRATVYAEETVTVETGGWLRGRIYTPRLQVAEGAGLSADLRISPSKGQ